MLSRHDLDTSRVVLFGRSLGGAVTIYLAATQGDKVGTGVLPAGPCELLAMGIPYVLLDRLQVM